MKTSFYNNNKNVNLTLKQKFDTNNSTYTCVFDWSLKCSCQGLSWENVASPIASPEVGPCQLLQVSAGSNSVWALTKDGQVSYWPQVYSKTEQSCIAQLLIGSTKVAFFVAVLSPGQTDRQVVASGRKFNLRRDLPLVAKRARKFYRKYTQVA